MQSKDEVLVQKAMEGDRHAFGQLVEKYKNVVYGLAYHLVRDFTEAQDLSQEAFLQAYLKLSQLKQPAKFSSWLRRITANTCKMWLRRPKPELVSWEELKNKHRLEDEFQLDSFSEAEEIKISVRESIDALSEKNRLTVTLYYMDGLTQKEIGDFLGVPLGTIKSRLHEAKKHLRKELTERGFGAPVITMVKESLQSEKLPDDFRVKLEEMLQSADAVVRRKAVHQLQEHHREDQTVEDLIIEATQDDDSKVRERAVQALGRIRCEKAIPLLAESLKDANPQVRKWAVWSLNRIGTEQVVDEVLKLLDYEGEATRRHAVDVLKDICTEKAVPRLTRALREDDDVGVRERIIHLLSSVKDDSVAQELVQLLWDNEQRIRRTAMDALEQMKPANIAPTLMKALDDENLEIQLRAIELLGILRHKNAESKLIQKLDTSEPSVVFKTAEALGKMKSEKALEPLMSLLQNHEKMRQVTSETCNLDSSITSTCSDVGAGVAKAIGSIGDKAAIPALMEFFEYLISLDSPRAHDSIIATIRTLGQIGDEQVAHRLARYLSDISSLEVYLRDWRHIPIRPLVRALAYIGSSVAVPYLAKLVDYPYFIGEETIGALGRFGPDAIPALSQVLAQNEIPHRRWRAAKALGEIGHPDALEPLKVALKDEEPQVRYHVAIALGQLGNEDAIPSLNSVLQDENHGVRKESLKSLKLLGVTESELPEIPDKPKGKKRKPKSERISPEQFQYLTLDYNLKLRLPAKDSLRRAILEKFVAENFEAGKVYQEKEMNEIISRMYDDYCSVRRYFVDYGMMSRDKGKYWVKVASGI